MKLNVRLYQDGVLPTCDVGAFYSLSYSAAEYVIPLLSDENEEIASAAEQYLRYQAESIESGYRTPHGKRDYTPALLRLRDRLSGVLGREIVIGQADSPF